jgi:hypothetical protein
MSHRSKDAKKHEEKKKPKLSIKEKRKKNKNMKSDLSIYFRGEGMKSKERYTVKTAKEKILIHTNDMEDALKIKEENKHEGAYIDDRKSKRKHRKTFFR